VLKRCVNGRLVEVFNFHFIRIFVTQNILRVNTSCECKYQNVKKDDYASLIQLVKCILCKKGPMFSGNIYLYWKKYKIYIIDEIKFKMYPNLGDKCLTRIFLTLKFFNTIFWTNSTFRFLITTWYRGIKKDFLYNIG